MACVHIISDISFSDNAVAVSMRQERSKQVNWNMFLLWDMSWPSFNIVNYCKLVKMLSILNLSLCLSFQTTKQNKWCYVFWWPLLGMCFWHLVSFFKALNRYSIIKKRTHSFSNKDMLLGGLSHVYWRGAASFLQSARQSQFQSKSTISLLNCIKSIASNSNQMLRDKTGHGTTIKMSRPQ